MRRPVCDLVLAPLWRILSRIFLLGGSSCDLCSRLKPGANKEDFQSYIGPKSERIQKTHVFCRAGAQKVNKYTENKHVFQSWAQRQKRLQREHMCFPELWPKR